MGRRSVNFLILGGMRCGSTTLRVLLDRHKEISLPRRELYYFSFSDTYRKGTAWYEERIGELTRETRLVGEKCVSYGYVAEACARISDYSRRMRLIWILRDPVERSVSHYLHNVRNGLERRPFEEAVREELITGSTPRFRSYLARSRYAKEIRRFLRYFPRGQLFVTTLEKLLIEPLSVLRGLFDFLGVAWGDYDYCETWENRGRRSLVPGLVGWCVRTFGYYSAAHRVVRTFSLRSLGALAAIDNARRKELAALFSESNQEVASLMDIDLSYWGHPWQ